MPGQRLGSMIGATFGLIYLLINAGALPLAASVPLRALGAAAFLAVLAAIRRPPARSTASHVPSFAGRGFGRLFWRVVAAEAAALAAGLALLNGPLHAPHAGVAWVSTVVGAHFFALAVVFGQRFFHRLGAAILACGVIGLVLAAGGAPVSLVATISGIVPGALLLASGWRGAHRTAPATAPATGR
jgi:hypothetical protein